MATSTNKDMSAKTWLASVLSKYKRDMRVCATQCGRFTVAMDDKGNIATAECSPDLQFQSDIGYAIAYAKLKKIPLHEVFTTPYHPQFTRGMRVYSKQFKRAGTVTEPENPVYLEANVKFDTDDAWDSGWMISIKKLVPIGE